MRQTYRLVALAIVLAGSTALGCEPIIPMFRVLVGAAALGGSLWILVAAVALKSVLFAVFQPSMSAWRAAILMVAANVLTTLVGLIAATFTAGVPVFLPLIGLPLAWFLALVPARRLIETTSRPWLARRSPAQVAAGVLGILLVSLLLFGGSQSAGVHNNLLAFWLLKLAWVYAGLFFSLFLTVYWEEWAIWKLAGAPEQHHSFIPAVLRANIYTLLAVALYAGAAILPERLASPGRLVALAFRLVTPA
jgi:hypothetical protein